jgi:hypothetical protein
MSLYGVVLSGHIGPSEYVGIILGAMLSESKQVLAYFFGDREDSANKTNLLYNSTPGKAANQ